MGSKQMSLKEERELEHFESLMYLKEQGTAKDPGPYWVTRQPWKIDKENLVDNKPAVLGNFFIKSNLLSPSKRQKKTDYQVCLSSISGLQIKPHITL